MVSSCGSGVTVDKAVGRVGDDAAGGEVDGGHGGAGEGQQQVGGAGAGDLEDVAGAVVEDGADGAERGAAGVDDGEADQVGVVELVVGQRRQAVAGGVEAGALQRLGLLAGGDAGQAGGEGAGDRAQELHAEAAAVLGDERGVAGDRGGVGAEGLQPHLAVHAEAAGDGADAGEAGRLRHRPPP